MRGSPNHTNFLFIEIAFKAVGVDDLLALLGRHGTQISHRCAHHALAVRRKLTKLAVELARLILLLGSQMFPRLHSVQHLQLPLRRETREMLQSLPQQLLPLCRQTPERWITLQRAFLLFWWEILVPPEPVAGMALLLRMGLGRALHLCPRGLHRMPLLGLADLPSLGGAGEGNRQSNRQTGDRRQFRNVSPPRHCCSFV